MLNMKTLYESLLDDDLVDKTDEMIIKDEIKSFLKANYNCKGSIKISEKPNKDDLYEVSSNFVVEVTNKNIISLTNGLFIWTTVDGGFYCNNCKFLKSLEGSPKEVGGGFYCYSCNSLKSLEGAPEKVEGDFYCNDCNSLTSLKGSPKEVGGGFYCSDCNSLKSLEGAPGKVSGTFYCSNCQSLKSLKGAPEKVGESFYCYNCKSLKSLEGAPKNVKKYFNCRGCKIQFTEDDVKKISNVKGEIKC